MNEQRVSWVRLEEAVRLEAKGEAAEQDSSRAPSLSLDGRKKDAWQDATAGVAGSV